MGAWGYYEDESDKFYDNIYFGAKKLGITVEPSFDYRLIIPSLFKVVDVSTKVGIIHKYQPKYISYINKKTENELKNYIKSQMTDNSLEWKSFPKRRDALNVQLRKINKVLETQ
jgi:hypothetical protein